jgi:RNA polymerase sigma factor (sigma-70 family)
VLIDEVRRGRRLVPLSESLVDESDPYEESAVAEALARVPDAQRRVLELVYVHGYSHAEIGLLLGTTEGAVKTAVWRARTSFKDEYLRQTAESPPPEEGVAP